MAINLTLNNAVFALSFPLALWLSLVTLLTLYAMSRTHTRAHR